MALTRTQKIAIVDEALRAHIPWDGDGADSRSLLDLRKAFERNHLGGLVRTYRRNKAERDLAAFDIADIA